MVTIAQSGAKRQLSYYRIWNGCFIWKVPDNKSMRIPCLNFCYVYSQLECEDDYYEYEAHLVHFRKNMFWKCFSVTCLDKGEK